MVRVNEEMKFVNRGWSKEKVLNEIELFLFEVKLDLDTAKNA